MFYYKGALSFPSWLLSLQTAEDDNDDADDAGGDVRMCCCGKPLSMALSPSCLYPPPSAIDHVAHYKSTVSWATLQVP